MFKYADEKGKSTAILAGSIEDISDALKEGHNVYVFCASRRDGDVIAECFANEYPVLYNAYTKGNARSDAVLRNQKLTDAKLFIGTSAAGVGISILDPKAKTVIVSGLTYGSRDPNMNAQESFRDRGRRGVAIHYTDYKFALPLKPSEAQDVSLYYEALKQASNQHSHLSEAGIKKIAHAQALTSLADAQFETFIGYHLGVVGNMPVYQASALSKAPAELERLSEIRKTLRRDEREKKLNTAVDMLNSRDLLTSSEIRVQSNKGQMSAPLRIAYESANGFARAVGWNDKIDRFNGETINDILDDLDIAAAVALAENNIDVERLAKQRRGYLAVTYPKWSENEFKTALAETTSDLVNDGLGLEITAVYDDRFLGRLIKALIDKIAGKVFERSEFAEAVARGVEIGSGHIRQNVYRRDASRCFGRE